MKGKEKRTQKWRSSNGGQEERRIHKKSRVSVGKSIQANRGSNTVESTDTEIEN